MKPETHARLRACTQDLELTDHPASLLQEIDKSRLLYEALAELARYGLRVESPVGNVTRFAVSTPRLLVRVDPGAGNSVLGELREAPGEVGGVVARVLDVHLATLVWDPSERRWYDRGGGPALDALVLGFVRALRLERGAVSGPVAGGGGE